MAGTIFELKTSSKAANAYIFKVKLTLILNCPRGSCIQTGYNHSTTTEACLKHTFKNLPVEWNVLEHSFCIPNYIPLFIYHPDSERMNTNVLYKSVPVIFFFKIHTIQIVAWNNNNNKKTKSLSRWVGLRTGVFRSHLMKMGPPWNACLGNGDTLQQNVNVQNVGYGSVLGTRGEKRLSLPFCRSGWGFNYSSEVVGHARNCQTALIWVRECDGMPVAPRPSDSMFWTGRSPTPTDVQSSLESILNNLAFERPPE